MMKNSFADLVRSAREHTGLTQKELALRAGVDDSYISRIERGTTAPPSRDKVVAITEALDITDQQERLMLLLAAGCANLDDLEALGSQEAARERPGKRPLLFASGSFSMSVPHTPSATQLEEEALLTRVRRLLDAPGLSAERRQEYIELLTSFVAWLEHRQSARS